MTDETATIYARLTEEQRARLSRAVAAALIALLIDLARDGAGRMAVAAASDGREHGGEKSAGACVSPGA